jgi:hypothetical protein
MNCLRNDGKRLNIIENRKHGYMHTETHVEWEDIDVIDEPVALKKKVTTPKIIPRI